jgi:hypothetical protein
VEQSADSVTYVMQLEAPGVTRLEQRITFSAHHPRIELFASLDKEDVRTPESIYFAFPLRLDKGWRSHYDSAGMFVEMEREQMGNACRDWLTVDQTVSIYDGDKGVTLACPDAPLVQVGNFNFGKESKEIPRDENPILLAWPMNNYWDTNFWISQPGRVGFRYELTPFDKFDPVEAYQAGVTAANPVAMNAAVECSGEQEGQWFRQTEGTIVPLHVKPATFGDGFVITLRNIGDKASEYVFAPTGRIVASAALVNTVEEQLQPAAQVGGNVHVPMQPGELVHLRIVLQ